MSVAADKGTYAEDFDLPFQKHMLAVLARTPGLIVRFRTALDINYFQSDVYRTVLSALLTSIDEHTVLPTQTTLIELCKLKAQADVLESVRKLIDELYTDDVTDHAEVAARIVEFAKQRAMEDAVVEAAAMVDQAERKEIRGLIEKAQLVGEDITDMGESYRSLIGSGRASLYETHPGDLIPTGIHHLDMALEGGLGRGELGVVIAPPKSRKTDFLINVGYGGMMTGAGHRGVHYTCELRKRKVWMRYDARLAGPFVSLRLTDKEKYETILDDRHRKFISGDIRVRDFPTRTLTATMINSHLTLLASQGYFVDFMVVDYGDIMKPERRLGKTWDESAGIYEDLRTLAGRWNIAVWTVSQTKQSAFGKETLTIADMGQAFEKVAIADAVMALCQTPEEMLNCRMRLKLLAMRNVASDSTVLCHINAVQHSIKSVALYDAEEKRLDAVESRGPKTGTSVVTEPNTYEALKHRVIGKSSGERVAISKTGEVSRRVIGKNGHSNGHSNGSVRVIGKYTLVDKRA